MGETVRDMQGSRRRGEQTQRAAVLVGRELLGAGNNQGCRGEDQDRGVFRVFLVRSAAGGVQLMGGQQARIVLEGRGDRLLVQRGVSGRVDRISVQRRGEEEGAVVRAVREAGRRCKLNRGFSKAFRGQTAAREGREQQISRGVLLDNAIDSRVGRRDAS